MTIPTDDTGDVFTVRSYDDERYTTDIPLIDGLRASDTLILDLELMYLQQQINHHLIFSRTFE